MLISSGTINRKGQAMILTTLALGGVILGATVIAGTLMLYQIRATTNAENSAKAIFAADAGTQWALFNYYCTETSTVNLEGKCPGVVSGPDGSEDNEYMAPPFLGSGASVTTTCYDASGNPSLCSDASDTVSAIAIGSSVDAERALYLTFSSAATP